jgi:hypothetical protein
MIELPPCLSTLVSQDPRIADMILGESDAVKMRKLAVLLSSETSCDDCRAEALENLEFIVESLDNANGIAL